MASPILDHPLTGTDGDLILVRLSVDPWHLEDLLDALSSISFPINPEIHHLKGVASVEFPAYTRRFPEVQDALSRRGFPPSIITTQGMLAGCLSG